MRDMAKIIETAYDNPLSHAAKEIAAGAAAIGTGYTMMGVGGYLVFSAAGTGPAAPVVAFAGGMTFAGGVVLTTFGGVLIYNSIAGH
jgi:hypothetical protein